MSNKIVNTITISFKKDELKYLEEFKSMYAVPTAIIKDFIINTVKGITSHVMEPYNNKVTEQVNKNSNSGIDLMDF